MTEGDTSLSFLMKRERPKVAPRGDALFTGNREKTDIEEDVPETSNPKLPPRPEQVLDRRSVERELASIPATTGIHLKVQPDPLQNLQSHLSKIDTTREVWVESAIAVAMENPDFLQLIDREAIKRYSIRKDWKKRKQALTRLLNTL